MANALKFTRGRDPAIIEIGSSSENGMVTIFVRDNGAGFDSEFTEKLFQVFQRLHRHDQFEGTGIGLASVRRLTERHGGKVSAEGAPGQGATFFISLPEGVNSNG
jgi:signal transduction histidine kinase